jgi:hypothetical protein
MRESPEPGHRHLENISVPAARVQRGQPDTGYELRLLGASALLRNIHSFRRSDAKLDPLSVRAADALCELATSYERPQDCGGGRI